MGILQVRILDWVAMPPPRDLPNPGIKPRSPALQADSLPSEPPGKPKNTGVGSLSLLQWIFLSQELNRYLLQCKEIIFQLNYQGSLHNFDSILHCYSWGMEFISWFWYLITFLWMHRFLASFWSPGKGKRPLVLSLYGLLWPLIFCFDLSDFDTW